MRILFQNYLDKNLANKFTIIVLVIWLLSLFTIYFFSFYFSKKSSIEKLEKDFIEIHQLVLEDFHVQKDFFFIERENLAFHQSGESKFVTVHHQLTNELTSRYNKAEEELLKLGFKDLSLMKETLKKIRLLNGEFIRYVALLKRRGYQAYGLSGELQDYLNAIQSKGNVSQVLLNETRKLNNEYLSTNSIESLKNLKDVLRDFEQARSEEDKNSSFNKQNEKLLSAYQNALDEYDRLGQVLEINVPKGVLVDLRYSFRVYENQQDTFLSAFHSWKIKELKFYQWIFGFGILLYLFCSLFIGRYLALRATHSLRKLNNYIKMYIASNFKLSIPLYEESKKDEVGDLAKNFKRLENEIGDHLENFQKHLSKRTNDLKNKNQELLVKNKMIDFQHKEIVSSIRYAQRIQRAMLPSQAEMNLNFNDHFLIYRPKDIVSGDFFWSYNDIRNGMNRLYFALGDCTGHGVPGAFMSILGTKILSNMLSKNEAVYPDEMLTNLDVRIKQDLESTGSEERLYDGMDIGLCMIDFDSGQLFYSGALFPLVYAYKGVLNVIPGDRGAINGEFDKRNFAYSRKTLGIEKVDTLYMFSDGIRDQFGGPRGKKFKTKNVLFLLEENCHLKMSEQKEIIEKAFEDWKGDQEQVDDVSMFGLNLKLLREQFNEVKHVRIQTRVKLLSNFGLLYSQERRN